MRQFGLIGYPLGHSFSKQYFTDKFLKEGLTDCFFEAYPLTSIDELPALLKGNPLLCGLSVTIPYKEQVLQYVSHLSEEVRQIGAANSIHINGSKLTAYNTDIVGFEESFKPLLKPYHKHALVLGTGGAAKAVQYVLRRLGIDYLIVSRSEKPGSNTITYSQLDTAIMAEHLLIINCSPAGMSPNIHTCPAIPYEYLGPGHYLYDLVYKPANTLFLQKGEERGALIRNGHDMLILQAEASWKIWNS